jgi:hypothetical protein
MATIRRAYSREEMVREAQMYMADTWGPVRESANPDRWHERLGMLVDFIHDRFPSNDKVSGGTPSAEADCSAWRLIE